MTVVLDRNDLKDECRDMTAAFIQPSDVKDELKETMRFASNVVVELNGESKILKCRTADLHGKTFVTAEGLQL